MCIFCVEARTIYTAVSAMSSSRRGSNSSRSSRGSKNSRGKRRQQRVIWVPEVILEEDENVEEDSPPPSPAAVASTLQLPQPHYVSLPAPESPLIQPASPISSPAPQQAQTVQPANQKKKKKKKTKWGILRKVRRGRTNKKRRSRSMRKLVRTIKFMKKWAKEKDAGDFHIAKYDRFLKKGYKRVGRRIIRLPPEDNFVVAWIKRKFPLDPSGPIVHWWLGILSCFILYNVFLLIARQAFELLNDAVLPFWLTLDYLTDIVYVIDIGVEFTTSHLAHNGQLEQSYRKIARRYVYSRVFVLDLLSLVPTDFLYLVGLGPFIRLNRLLRVSKVYRFVHRTESHTNYPNMVRISLLILYITLLIHWNACGYFLISARIGFGNDTWVYPALTSEDGNETAFAPLTRQYLFSFYWSTLTLTTIGELPGPQTDWEYFFVIADFMVGVLVFATIVGMVGAIISNTNLRRLEFQRKLDNMKHYMRYRSVGKNLQLRVIKWFDYLWTNRHTFEEEEVLQTLPDKLRAEISIHVHFDTLRRVKIFEECEAALLEELVLKLKPQVYSPGDYVCRKGDIGKEMYIVKQGILEVLTDNGKILTTLTDGGHFGEISILNLSGCGNRRTAHVRSVGFSELFSLSKTDLLEALLEYPEAREALERRGRETLMRDKSLTKSERTNSLSFGRDKRGKPTTAMQLLSDRMDMLEEGLQMVQSKFARLVGEYSTTQIRLKKRVRSLEARLKEANKVISEMRSEHSADEETGEEEAGKKARESPAKRVGKKIRERLAKKVGKRPHERAGRKVEVRAVKRIKRAHKIAEDKV